MSWHGAPSVCYPVGRSRFVVRLVFMLWVLGALALVFTALSRAPLPFAHLLAWGAGLGGWGLCIHRWALRLPVGFLRFQEGQWLWLEDLAADGCPCQPTVFWDSPTTLGLMLKWQGAAPMGRSRTAFGVWAQREAEPAFWLDFRRAVYSSAHPASNASF